MDTAQDPAISPGQVEMRRAQDSKDTPASRCPLAVQISAPASREHLDQCRVGAAVMTGGADSRAGDLAAANVLFLLMSSGTWERASAKGQRPHRKNIPLRQAPGG